jgi:hypothetical protein
MDPGLSRPVGAQSRGHPHQLRALLVPLPLGKAAALAPLNEATGQAASAISRHSSLITQLRKSSNWGSSVRTVQNATVVPSPRHPRHLQALLTPQPFRKVVTYALPIDD